MDAKDTIFSLGIIFSIVMSIIGGYAALKNIRPKNLLDGSQAAENFQDIVIRLQGEVKELRDRVDGKQLKVHMTIEIDKAPIVDHWQWINTNDADTKQLPPRRQNGFGR